MNSLRSSAWRTAPSASSTAPGQKTLPTTDARCSRAFSGPVRPVEVFEDEHERALLGRGLDEAAPGGERLRSVCAELSLEPDERSRVPGDPRALRLLEPERLEHRRELRLDVLGRVRLEDAGM